MDIKVLVACHKKVEVPQDELYLPIQVGAYNRESIGFQRDDEGNNISSLNPYYSELTGLYWAWKNLSFEYLGLCHYRRYFAIQRGLKNTLDNVLKEEELEPLLGKYRLIVPRKRKYYVETLYSHYSHTMEERHLIETRRIIEELCPEYLETYDTTLKQIYGYMFNMFIMSKEDVNAYCAWVFPILEKLIERVGTYENAFANRYAGRISERLFNVWLNQQRLNKTINDSDIYEMQYVYLGEVNYFNKVISFIKAKVFKKKYNQSF